SQSRQASTERRSCSSVEMWRAGAPSCVRAPKFKFSMFNRAIVASLSPTSAKSALVIPSNRFSAEQSVVAFDRPGTGGKTAPADQLLLRHRFRCRQPDQPSPTPPADIAASTTLDSPGNQLTTVFGLRCSIQLSYMTHVMTGFEPATFRVIEVTLVFTTGESFYTSTASPTRSSLALVPGPTARLGTPPSSALLRFLPRPRSIDHPFAKFLSSFTGNEITTVQRGQQD